MFVICKKAMLFQKDKIVDDLEVGLRRQIVEDSFMIYPNPGYTPQFAPDWVKDTDLYKMAEKDGAMVETTSGPPSPEEQEQDANRKTPAGPKGATSGLPQHHSQEHQAGWKK